MRQSSPRMHKASAAMIFVEGFRLLFVLSGSFAGFEIGRDFGSGPNAALAGLLFGAAISYVIGGVGGRLADRGLQRAVFLFRNTPPGEIFAASIISTTGMLLGLLTGLPLLVLLRSASALLIASVLAWMLATLGWRIGSIKGRQIVKAAGLSRILGPSEEPPPGDALLVDISAAMDRSLMIFGRAGLLPEGLIVPQFVIDNLRSIMETPDPVASRRARRGLESLEALRELGVEVNIAPDEIPEVDELDIKMLTLGRRIGLRMVTTSSHMAQLAHEWELPCVDLRGVVSELSPYHLPGEVLSVELVKAGRQARQAIGYLPDGDMVVVNDASHAIHGGAVRVNVLSSRPTSQGMMVFAALAEDESADERAAGGRTLSIG